MDDLLHHIDLSSSKGADTVTISRPGLSGAMTTTTEPVVSARSSNTNSSMLPSLSGPPISISGGGVYDGGQCLIPGLQAGSDPWFDAQSTPAATAVAPSAVHMAHQSLMMTAPASVPQPFYHLNMGPSLPPGAASYVLATPPPQQLQQYHHHQPSQMGPMGPLVSFHQQLAHQAATQQQMAAMLNSHLVAANPAMSNHSSSPISALSLGHISPGPVGFVNHNVATAPSYHHFVNRALSTSALPLDSVEGSLIDPALVTNDVLNANGMAAMKPPPGMLFDLNEPPVVRQSVLAGAGISPLANDDVFDYQQAPVIPIDVSVSELVRSGSQSSRNSRNGSAARDSVSSLREQLALATNTTQSNDHQHCGSKSIPVNSKKKVTFSDPWPEVALNDDGDFSSVEDSEFQPFTKTGVNRYTTNAVSASIKADEPKKFLDNENLDDLSDDEDELFASIYSRPGSRDADSSRPLMPRKQTRSGSESAQKGPLNKFFGGDAINDSSEQGVAVLLRKSRRNRSFRWCCFLALNILLGIIVTFIVLGLKRKLKPFVSSSNHTTFFDFSSSKNLSSSLTCSRLKSSMVWEISFTGLSPFTLAMRQDDRQSKRVEPIKPVAIQKVDRGFGTKAVKDANGSPADPISVAYAAQPTSEKQSEKCLATGICSTVFALNFTTGEMLWDNWMISGEVTSLGCLVDVDGDMMTDCIVTTDRGKMHAICGKSGRILWSFDSGDDSHAIYRPAWIPDMDSDGVQDLVVVFKPLRNSRTGKDMSYTAVVSAKSGSSPAKYDLKLDPNFVISAPPLAYQVFPDKTWHIMLSIRNYAGNTKEMRVVRLSDILKADGKVGGQDFEGSEFTLVGGQDMIPPWHLTSALSHFKPQLVAVTRPDAGIEVYSLGQRKVLWKLNNRHQNAGLIYQPIVGNFLPTVKGPLVAVQQSKPGLRELQLFMEILFLRSSESNVTQYSVVTLGDGDFMDDPMTFRLRGGSSDTGLTVDLLVMFVETAKCRKNTKPSKSTMCLPSLEDSSHTQLKLLAVGGHLGSSASLLKELNLLGEENLPDGSDYGWFERYGCAGRVGSSDLIVTMKRNSKAEIAAVNDCFDDYVPPDYSDNIGIYPSFRANYKERCMKSGLNYQQSTRKQLFVRRFKLACECGANKNCARFV